MISDNGVLVVMARMLLPGRPERHRVCRRTPGGAIVGHAAAGRSTMTMDPKSGEPQRSGRRRPGIHQPRDLRQRGDLPAGAGAGVRPRLALHRPREPDPQAGRLLRVVAWARSRSSSAATGAGAIHVFLNTCRHRGMKVCRYDEGNTVEFMCPYHGWSYGTDGALVGVPFLRTPTARSSIAASGG